MGLGMIDEASYGRCARCRASWKFANGHDTPYSDNEGCFPLCEACWHDLATPDARLPFYEHLILDVWDEPAKWAAVERAVRAGL